MKKVPPQLKEQKDTLHAIKALGDTEGGKALLALLVEDMAGSIHKLINGGDVTVEIAEIKSRMELSKLILNAKESERELDKMIADALLE